MVKQICYIGSKYDSTKELSTGELIHFIERDLKLLSNKNYELSLSFLVQNHFNNTEKRHEFIIDVLMKRPPANQFLLEVEIEDILWTYNKQVLNQKGGRFYTHYIRFGYSLRYKPVDAPLGVVSHLKVCNE